MEYAVFPASYNGVLRKTLDDGVVFADKNSNTIDGFGVWKIVHRGLDKNKKPYAIAKPVMALTHPQIQILLYESESAVWDSSVQKLRLENAFPEFDCTDLEGLVRLCEKFGQDKVYEVSQTPLSCEGVDFYVSPLFCGCTRKPGDSVCVEYVNGEIGYKSVAWVTKHKDNLVNTRLTVFGSELDSLSVLLEHIEPDSKEE